MDIRRSLASLAPLVKHTLCSPKTLPLFSRITPKKINEFERKFQTT